MSTQSPNLWPTSARWPTLVKPCATCSASLPGLGSAMVAQQRSMYTLRQREQAVTLEARNAIHQLEQAKLSMAAARIAVDVARKNLQAEERKYELGAQTIFFVLDAQTQLSQAEQELLRAQISYQRAVTAVDRATGALLARNNVQITDAIK